MKLFILLLSLSVTAQSADWPTYRANNRRSGTSEESLSPRLKMIWKHQAGVPQPAWTAPAKWDAYSANAGLQSMRNFDLCHYVSIANNQLFYGSSADNALHCIDLKNGKTEWTFFSNGAVRLPPSISDNKAYFGSDDGNAYCVDTESGKEVWSTSGAPTKNYFMSNGKLISTHPVRTGVTLVGDKAIFGASILPWEDSYLVGVSQKDGSDDGGFRITTKKQTLQGAILHGSGSLIVTQGRQASLKFDATTGKALGSIGSAGGISCLLTDDDQFISGPQNQRSRDEQMRLINQKGDHIATFGNANRVAIYKNMAYIHSNGEIKSLDRVAHSEPRERQFQLAKERKTLEKQLKSQKNKNAALEKKIAEGGEDVPAAEIVSLEDLVKEIKTNKESSKFLEKEAEAAWTWAIKANSPTDMIVAGDHLIVGFAGKVEMFERRSGKSVWKAPIDGVAYGLAVSNGVLIVSTNKGEIIAFAKK